jgi:hypothetical protein
MAPFRDCLSRYGVSPSELRSPPGERQAPDSADGQEWIQAAIACIPQLPPQLRQQAERLKKRYQQGNG